MKFDKDGTMKLLSIILVDAISRRAMAYEHMIEYMNDNLNSYIVSNLLDTKKKMTQVRLKDYKFHL